MLKAEFAKLEGIERRRVGALRRGDTLLLIEARNTVRVLALFRAAVLSGRPAAIVERSVLDQLDVIPVLSGRESLFIMAAVGLEGAKLVCFTSGSSGTAKGILRSYESWLRTFEVQRNTLNYSANASVLILGNLAHSLHLYGAMEALDRGVLPTVLEKFSPKQVVDWCRSLGVEMIYATPAHLNLMLAYGRKRPVPPLPSVTHILAGGAKLDERHFAQLKALFPHARIVEFFGTTETSYITMKSPDSPTGSVGKPLSGVTLQVTDDHGHVLPPGHEGMLWIKSDMLFEAYVFGEDPNTRWRGGFVTVGDQGYLDPDGNLFFTARIGSMVTIAGENVFLDHVEQRLQARVGAGESAILPIEDPLRGRRLVAVTQFEMPGGEAGAILRSLREEFGPLKSPKSLIHMKDWPFLPSGKTDRQTLLKRVAGKV